MAENVLNLFRRHAFEIVEVDYENGGGIRGVLFLTS